MFKSADVILLLFCYFLAFLLDMLKLRWKQSVTLKSADFTFLTLGVVFHGTLLYRHNLLQNAHFFANASDWFYVLAFCLVLVLSYLKVSYPRTPFGLFLLPPIIATTIAGTYVSELVFSADGTWRCVRAIHGASLLLTTLCSCLGGIAGMMFVWQRSRMKHKIFTVKITLPSLEWLSYAIRHASNLAIVMLGLGILSGFYLKVFASKGEGETAEFTIDRVMLGATFLFLFALCLRLKAFWKRAAYTNNHDAVLAFTLCIALIVLLSFAAFENNGHWKTLIPPQSTVNELNNATLEQSPPPSGELDADRTL